MLLTDKDHAIDVVVLIPDGKPVADRHLLFSEYKIDWRWWYEKSEEKLSDYFD